MKKASPSSLRYAFARIIWPRRWLLALGLGLITLNRLSGLVLPGASQYLIDDVIKQGNRDLFPWLLGAVAGAVVVQSTTAFFLTRLLSVEAQHLISRLRAQVQRHVIQLPTRYFDNAKSGELVSRIMTDVEGVRNLVGTGFVQLIGGVLTASVAFVLLVRINALMTVCALIPLGIFGLISLKAFATIRPIFRQRRQINAEVTGRLTESLGGIRVIKGFNAEAHEIDIFETGVDRLFRNVRRSLTATSLLTSTSTLLLGLATVGVMGLGGSLILDEKLSVGEFVAFVLYLGFLVAPILQMSNIGSQMVDALAGLDRMSEVLSLAREDDDPMRTRVLETVEGDLTFEHVDFAYETDQPVLEDITFEAPTGTVTALVGSSGSGKTTLASLAGGFIQPDAGVVRVDGVDLSTVKLESYRRHLGVVLQDDFLYEGTIRENILFAKPDADDDALEAAATAAYVNEFTDRFPDGLDTLIGERGVKLSGGQRQRVALARAILADPRVLILDEATSSLDTDSERYIQQSLETLLQGRTTFVIAHRLSTIRRADQILVIEDGRIVERGTHDELIALNGRYQQLYTYQARI